MRLLCLTLAFVILSGAAFGGEITGVLKTTDGGNFPHGCTVQAWRADGTLVNSATVDGGGAFTLDVTGPGTLRLVFHRHGQVEPSPHQLGGVDGAVDTDIGTIYVP